MPFTIERLAGEPIIVTTYSGTLTVETLRDSYTAMAELMRDINGRVYRIGDLTNTEGSNFGEVMKMVREASKGAPTTTTDPNVTVALVGGNTWSKLFVDTMRQEQFAGVQLPIFKTREEALAWIRVQIANHQTERSE